MRTKFFKVFRTWGAAASQPVEWLQPLAAATEDLKAKAAAVGVKNLDNTYLMVSDAARQCGLGDHFSVNNKFLSKFAHPTAMQIIASADDVRDTLQRDVFFSQGCTYFKAAFDIMEVYMEPSVVP